ncbi:unnamed protein product [Lasius platythorax]|uniref:Uncharacterized protein n=1 Tax=Lasius platythorax TaxID=488582 RepID=A0AAV2P2F6_9HYME
MGRATPFSNACRMYREEPRILQMPTRRISDKAAEYRHNGRARVRFDSAHLDDLSWMLFVYNTANNNCRWDTSMIFRDKERSGRFHELCRTVESPFESDREGSIRSIASLMH